MNATTEMVLTTVEDFDDAHFDFYTDMGEKNKYRTERQKMNLIKKYTKVHSKPFKVDGKTWLVVDRIMIG